MSYSFQLFRKSLSLTFPAFVHLQCFVQPVEDDFVFVRQSTRFTMILGPIFAGESDELLWSLQRIVHLLRLIAARQNIPLCVQNKAGALNLFGDPSIVNGLSFVER